MNKQEVSKEINNAKPTQLTTYDYVETIKNSEKVINAIKTKIKQAKKPLMLVVIEQA